MTSYLLDTNIISAVIRKEVPAEQALRRAVSREDTILLSAIIFYEVKRGLLKRDAKKQMDALEHLVGQFAWCDVAHDDWEQAAQLWAEREKAGRPIEDADVLIAAQAKHLGAILVTDNEKDFEGLGVKVENWRKSKE